MPPETPRIFREPDHWYETEIYCHYCTNAARVETDTPLGPRSMCNFHYVRFTTDTNRQQKGGG